MGLKDPPRPRPQDDDVEPELRPLVRALVDLLLADLRAPATLEGKRDEQEAA